MQTCACNNDRLSLKLRINAPVRTDIRDMWFIVITVSIFLDGMKELYKYNNNNNNSNNIYIF